MNQEKKEGKKGADACELTRTCCETKGLNYVCFRNDPLDFATFDSEDIRAATGNSSSIETAAFFMHPRNGLFYSNQGEVNFGWGMKGGMTRIRSPMYGNVNGWAPSGEGAVVYASWYPHKYQAYNSQNLFSYEFEVVYLKNAVIMKNRVKCTTTGGCTQANNHPVYFKMSSWDNSVGGSSQVASTPIYGAYGSGYGYSMNIQGVGWENPAFNKNWYFLVNEQPLSNEVIAPNQGRIYYDLAYGETKDLIFVVTIEDYLSEASDMLQNYESYEGQAELDFENYANGFDKIAGDNELQKLYYRSIYGLYTYIFPPSGAMVNSFVTPNIGTLFNRVENRWAAGTSNYMGQWVWDSAVASLGWVSSCNPGNACWDDLNSVQKTWDDYTFGEGVHNWCPELHPDGGNILGTSCGINVPGLWPMIAYNKYLKDSDLTSLCNIYPNMKSNDMWIKQNRDSDNDYLFSAGAGEMGRDGSTNYAGPEQPTITGWMMLDSLYLSKIAEICNPSDVTYFETQYSSIASAYESSFWDPAYQTYCYVNSPGSCVVTDGVEHDDTLSLNFANIFNTHSGTKDSIVLNKVLNDFRDTYYPTSVPTDSPCYIPFGNDIPTCTYGDTWDGPIWPQDEFLMNEMFFKLEDRGIAGASTQHQLYEDQTVRLYQTLPFPAESYDAHNGYSAQWGATPHSSNSGYIIYQISGKEMIKTDSVPTPTINVVCIGDSNTNRVSSANPTTTGYCNRLAIDNEFIGTAYKRGWDGTTSYDMVVQCYSSQPSCIDMVLNEHLDADWAILMIGTNDLYSGTQIVDSTTVSQYYNYMTQAVQKLKNSGLKVVLSTIPPCNADVNQCPGNDQTKVIERNNVIRRISDEQNVVYADVFTEVFSGTWTHQLMKWDGVHVHYESEEGITCDYILNNEVTDCATMDMARVYATAITSGSPYNCDSHPNTCYTPSTYDYNYFTTSTSSFINGGSFSTFITNANQWVSS